MAVPALPPLNLNSTTASEARGEQTNIRGASGVVINHGGGWQDSIPFLAVLAVAAVYLLRRKN